MVGKKIQRVLLAVISCLGVAGCASRGLSEESSGPPGLFASGRAAHSINCVFDPGGHSVLPLAPTAVDDILVYAQNGTSQPSVNRVLGIRGDCVDAIIGYQSVSDVVYLRDGRVFAVQPQFKVAVDHKQVGPRLSTLPGRTDPDFVMAERVAYTKRSAGMSQVFIGLWRGSAGSTIRFFLVEETGQISETKEVLRSHLPLQSLRYLTAVDTPSGRLSLTIRQQDLLLLASFDLKHPDWTATFK